MWKIEVKPCMFENDIAQIKKIKTYRIHLQSTSDQQHLFIYIQNLNLNLNIGHV